MGQLFGELSEDFGPKRTWDDLVQRGFSQGDRLHLVGKMDATKYTRDVYARALEQALTNVKVLTLKRGAMESLMDPLGLVEVLTVVQVLAKNTTPTLESINVSGNEQLGDTAGIAVARMLQTNTSLKEIVMEMSGLTNKSCAAFVTSLQTNTSLQTLNVSFNNIKDPSPLMQSTTTLKSLNLRCGYIHDYEHKIGPALAVNSSLEELDLGENQLEIQSVGMISNALRTNSCLKSIHVGIHDWFFYKNPGHILLAFGKALGQNATLEKLSLQAAIHEGTEIPEDMAGAELVADEWNCFFRALNQNGTLEELTLDLNLVFVLEESEAFAASLATNTTLKKLSITVKRLLKATPGGVAEAAPNDVFAPFAHVLETNHTLESLEIRYLPFVYEEGGAEAVMSGAPFFAALEQTNTTLKAIKLPVSRSDEAKLMCYCRLNGAGRQNLMENIETAGIDTWVDAMIAVKDHVACLDHLLRMNPELFAKSALAAFKHGVSPMTNAWFVASQEVQPDNSDEAADEQMFSPEMFMQLLTAAGVPPIPGFPPSG